VNFSSVNYIGLFVAAVAGFVVGALWFSPKTFFPVWWKLMGKTEGDDPGAGQNMGAIFGALVIGQIVQSIALTGAIAGFYANASVLQGAATGALLGIGIAASSSLTHRMFSGLGKNAWNVWAIEVGNDIVALIVMGAIIAAIS
jgi:Protein of unknown function (DUF1761)